MYSLPFTVTIETKIREFQCKVLISYLQMKNSLGCSPSCTFCKREVESFEQIFFYCDMTKTFCSWPGECTVKFHPLQ